MTKCHRYAGVLRLGYVNSDTEESTLHGVQQCETTHGNGYREMVSSFPQRRQPGKSSATAVRRIHNDQSSSDDAATSFLPASSPRRNGTQKFTETTPQYQRRDWDSGVVQQRRQDGSSSESISLDPRTVSDGSRTDWVSTQLPDQLDQLPDW